MFYFDSTHKQQQEGHPSVFGDGWRRRVAANLRQREAEARSRGTNVQRRPTRTFEKMRVHAKNIVAVRIEHEFGALMQRLGYDHQVLERRRVVDNVAIPVPKEGMGGAANPASNLLQSRGNEGEEAMRGICQRVQRGVTTSNKTHANVRMCTAYCAENARVRDQRLFRASPQDVDPVLVDREPQVLGQRGGVPTPTP
jgi:hypothetical protein